jgi:hypothetical protein
MTKVLENKTPLPKNDNLKNLKPFSGAPSRKLKTSEIEKDAVKLSQAAKAPTSLQETESTKPLSDSAKSIEKAQEVASKLSQLPVLPIVIPSSTNQVEKKIEDKKLFTHQMIKKPAVIFIEGFSAFGISNGDGVKDMADNYPGAKRFSWDEKDKILEEIHKHSPDQPVVLVGHSFGGDSAVEIANELNSTKNNFRPIDLLVTLDSVGFNNTIIPLNVKKNLNFFQEGIIPFLHGSPNIARNTNHTEVTNELRSELHSRIDDSNEVQFNIFEHINQTLGKTSNDSEIKNEKENSSTHILIDIDLADIIDSQ